MDDPLALDPETMRATGYRMVDLLVEHVGGVRDRPALTRASPAEMRARLHGPPPEAGTDFEAMLAVLERDVLAHMGRVDHPAYFAFIPGSSTWPGALGDFLASALNVYAGSWMESSGPSQVELQVLDWFKDWIGYPAEAAGILLSGGSAANMTALACARESQVGAMRDDLVVYVSDQAHSSLARAARTLGFRPDQVTVLPVDAEHRMRPDLLAGAMAADVAAGRRPLFVSVSAGSTNTGAIDPLAELADVVRGHGAWLHVDGAYGGFASLTERGRGWLAGIERADSVTLDPHKWLYQPFECGCLLVREGSRLRRAFTLTPDYLADAEAEDEEVNFSDLGIQLTRSARALKVWMSVTLFGAAAFRAAIDAALDLALLAEARVREQPSLELLSPAQLGIVCFRRRCAGGAGGADAQVAGNAALVRAFAASGRGLVSSTRLNGAYAIRLCALNHASTAEDVEATLDWLATADAPPAPLGTARGIARPGARQATVAEAESGVGVEPAALAAVPLFASLDPLRLSVLAAGARAEARSAGEAVVRRFESGRDFYLILAGRASVLVDDRDVRALGPGDFFGELAALDWGADYHYPRLATVVASTDLRLAKLTAEALRALMGAVPAIRAAVRRAAAERLAVT
ncbi:MAG: aminotransferase class V-fold PLP-dependent enzyme [Solirubrobacteraceae bacterium]